MSNAIKYNFDNVLVADTKLLVQVGKVRGGPQILVLNNKLNKCEHRKQPIRCDTCCLQVEEPQFKRRSDIFKNTTDCFAKCSERRLVSIGLNAKSRLSGKLVILGLTRIHNLRRESSSSLRPIKCRTELMLPYSRFEPSNDALIGSRSMSLTYYSKFSHNQLPSISIDSAELYWDNSKQREMVSFTLESSRDRGGQDNISLKEALVVIEMSCSYPQTSGSDSFELKFLRKIHLLALLNRDVIPEKNIVKPIIELNTKPALDSFPIKEQTRFLPDTIQTVNFNQTELVKVDSSRIERTNQNNVNNPILDEHNTTIKNLGIDSRIDLSSETVKDLIAYHDHITESATNNSLPARFAPGLVNLRDLDSISMRLKSNSFLILTVSCSFVILTYTLCLLIYLKARKNRGKNLETKRNKTRRSNQQQQVAANISHPFNLQMPPDTQNRLDNLLNACGKVSPINSIRSHPKQDQQKQQFQHQQTNHYTELDDQHKLVKSRHKITPSKRFRCCQFEDDLSCQCEHNCYFDDGSHIQTQNQPNFAYYGTLTIMRAIRQAASLARYRLRNSRYQPNLKAIPESDYEQAQTLSRGSLEQCEQFMNEANEISSSIKAEQIETLLYNAMKSKCSHSAEKARKRKRKCSDQETNATLFSKPIDSATESNEISDVESDPISRIRIIRHLQSEATGDETGLDLDTRI